MRYLRHWLVSPTDEECPLGGKASYGNAISLSADNSSVVASHFRTYHTPLKTQEDFINALAAARRVADDLSRRTKATVYPYSLFYVFFDQVSLLSFLCPFQNFTDHPFFCPLRSTVRSRRLHHRSSPLPRSRLNPSRHFPPPRIVENRSRRHPHLRSCRLRSHGDDGSLGNQPQRHLPRQPGHLARNRR